MRIPCAKCGHLHDSTVTPFLHDVVKEDNVFGKEVIDSPEPALPTLASYGKYKISKFRCEKCGAVNDVLLMWLVLEEEEEVAGDVDYGGFDGGI